MGFVCSWFDSHLFYWSFYIAYSNFIIIIWVCYQLIQPLVCVVMLICPNLLSSKMYGIHKRYLLNIYSVSGMF